MASYFGYKILNEQRLLIQYYRGIVNLNISIRSRTIIMKDTCFDPSFHSIVDFRDAFLEFEESDAEKFTGFLKKENDLHKDKKTAYLSRTPDQVVLLSLYSSFTERMKLKNNFFSTLKSLLSWLVYDIHLLPKIEEELMILQVNSKIIS
jgi:hypothetical protein